jgi:hypothetical protein
MFTATAIESILSVSPFMSVPPAPVVASSARNARFLPANAVGVEPETLTSVRWIWKAGEVPPLPTEQAAATARAIAESR